MKINYEAKEETFIIVNYSEELAKKTHKRASRSGQSNSRISLIKCRTSK